MGSPILSCPTAGIATAAPAVGFTLCLCHPVNAADGSLATGEGTGRRGEVRGHGEGGEEVFLGRGGQNIRTGPGDEWNQQKPPLPDSIPVGFESLTWDS